MKVYTPEQPILILEGLTMDGDAIKKWSKQYEENYDKELRKIEDELTTTLGTQQYIDQSQLEQVVRWKLNGQPGRRDRFIEQLNTVPDAFIRRISEAAFLLDDPKTQLETLTSIPGIGPATASVVLAFYDPTRYAVGDRYIVAALLDADRSMRTTDYALILTELRERNSGSFDLRTVEKAYYQQYRDTYDVGRW